MASSLTTAVQTLWGKAFSISQGFNAKAHDGLDIAAKEGTPVYAVASGVVEYARDARIQNDKGASGWAMGGGNTVNVNIGNKLAVQYAHLQSMTVKEGQAITKGQLIGYVGRTGGKTASGAFGGPGSKFVGPHVHFGLWDHVKNKMIDPTSLLVSSAGGADPGDYKDSRPPTPVILAAWDGLVSFQEGHPLTAGDVDQIMTVLKGTTMFSGDIPDPLNFGHGFEGAGAKTVRATLEKHIGQPWNAGLLKTIQGELGIKAGEAGDPLKGVGTALGGVLDPITGIGDTITKLGTYTLAVVVVVIGLVIYSRSAGGTGEALA